MSSRNALQGLITSAGQFKAALKAHLNSPTYTLINPTLEVPQLRLAKLIDGFRSDMIQNGLLLQVRDLASSKAIQLATSYQNYYARICHGLMALPAHEDDPPLADVFENLRIAFERLYEKKDLPKFMSDISKAHANHCKHLDRHPQLSSDRRSFNHEYTPLLEKYFKHNAYPSVADRLVLARKSMMTPRQIEVWFQNHRNRAKKDGKVLKRWASNSPLDISLESLSHRMSWFPISEMVRNEPSSCDPSDEESTNEDGDIPQITNASNDSFTFLTPPHAFPTRYPPNCDEDPFPNKHGVFKFPPPNWRRRPTTTTSRQTTPNIDELTALFALKLNLRESGNKKHSARNAHLYKDTQPWFAATVTVPSPAPHPAFVSILIKQTSSSLLPLTSTISPPQSDVSSPQLQPISPLSLCQSQAQSKCTPRKIARLPRRTPSNFASSDITASSPRLHTSPCRTSSLSSVASSQSNSDHFSEPITPPCSPTIQTEELIFAEEAFPGIRYALDEISSWHMGSSAGHMIAKQISSSRLPHEVSPHTHYLLAQS